MSGLLDIDSLSVAFDGAVAVTEVSLRVDPGETVAVVGGSGAGKSTLVRAVAGLLRPTSGVIRFDGVELTAGDRSSRRRRRAARRGMHLVFQDPYASLPPHLRVGDIVAEPQVIHRQGDSASRRAAALAALERVRLTPAADYAGRFPHELSGGQRQRVAFARATVTAPRLLLADEPASGLDASLRVEIVDLMTDLAATTGMAVLHITHDLALAARSCDRTVVMCDGRIVETGRTSDVLATPTHEYTAALVAAASVRPRSRPAQEV